MIEAQFVHSYITVVCERIDLFVVDSIPSSHSYFRLFSVFR